MTQESGRRRSVAKAGGSAASALIVALVLPVVDGVAQLRGRGDAQSVHRLRVALARLRVALWLFPDAIADGGAALESELKWLRRLASPLRDWDVFIASCGAIAAADDAPPGMVDLLERAAANREHVLDRIRPRLAGDRCRRLLRALRRLGQHAEPDGGEAPLLWRARGRLKPQLAKVHRQGRRIEELGDRQLHRLRIRLRRPRYACELLQPYGDAARCEAYHKTLARLHTRLGAIQDAAIGERLVALLREQDDGPDLRVATRAVLARLRHNAKRRRRQFREAWQAFEAVPAFWKPARG